MARTNARDQVGTYAAKRRSVSLTERAILNGFGKKNPMLTARDLADRLEISTVALAPHLQSLLAKGEVVAVHEAGRVRYRRRVAG